MRKIFNQTLLKYPTMLQTSNPVATCQALDHFLAKRSVRVRSLVYLSAFVAQEKFLYLDTALLLPVLGNIIHNQHDSVLARWEISSV